MEPIRPDALITRPRLLDDPTTRRPSRRRLLWLVTSGLVGAPLAGVAALRLAGAEGGNDADDQDEVDHDDGGDSSGRGRGRGRGRGGREDDADGEELAPAADIPAGSAVVEILDDDGFTPSTLTIDAGQMVTFVNLHSDDHTATGSAFDTGIIPEGGGTASVVLDTPGSYPFACLIHPEMVGELRVRDEAGNVPERAPASPAPVDAVPVQIVNLSFTPASVTVPAGGSVAWTNDDSLPHTATALDGSFDSGILDPGASFSWTFDAPGTIAYQCSLHPQMRGEVVVTGEASASSQQRAVASPAATQAATPAATPVGTPAGVASVDIVDLAFEPARLTVTTGVEVVWTNTGQVPHTVSGDAVSSPVLEPGAVFRQTFTEAGTVDYFCAIHPQMTGQVVVEPA